MHKRDEAQGSHWHVAMQPGKRRQLDPKRKWARLIEQAEQLKASIRAKVEHPFHVIKNLFRHKKVRYKGLAKKRGAAVQPVRSGQSADRQEATLEPACPTCVLSAEGALGKGARGPQKLLRSLYSEPACRSTCLA